MKQTIVIFPETSKFIEDIRKKYDPNYEKVKTHISLVYSLEGVNPDELVKHIQNSLIKFEKFEIELIGLQSSTKGYYLYLLIGKGKEKLIRLHEKLNSGLLGGFRNKDVLDYVPHITLGIFNSEESLIGAMKEIKEGGLSIKKEIDSIYLITLEGDRLVSKKEFRLGGIYEVH